MDLLFMFLGFIPTAFAVIWFFGSHIDTKEPTSVDTIGSISLAVFGLSLTGNLRSCLKNNTSIGLIILCCVCFIIAAICIYIKNKNDKG